MTYPYIIPDIFQEQFNSLDPKLKKIVKEKINFIITNPRNKRTSRVIDLGRAEFRECPASRDYRIFYTIENEQINFLILFLTIKHIEGHKIYSGKNLKQIQTMYRNIKEKGNVSTLKGPF